MRPQTPPSVQNKDMSQNGRGWLPEARRLTVPGAGPYVTVRAASPGSGAYTVCSASVDERRAARIDGYSPAIAPMTRAAPRPP